MQSERERGMAERETSGALRAWGHMRLELCQLYTMSPVPRAQPVMRLSRTPPGFAITSGRSATDGDTQVRVGLPSAAAVRSAR